VSKHNIVFLNIFKLEIFFDGFETPQYFCTSTAISLHHSFRNKK
jgi:hypothetical protein